MMQKGRTDSHPSDGVVFIHLVFHEITGSISPSLHDSVRSSLLLCDRAFFSLGMMVLVLEVGGMGHKYKED